MEGFFTLNFGAIIVAFHNVWHGPAMVLTLIGWAQVLKGIGRFVAPQLALAFSLSLNPGSAVGIPSLYRKPDRPLGRFPETGIDVEKADRKGGGLGPAGKTLLFGCGKGVSFFPRAGIAKSLFLPNLHAQGSEGQGPGGEGLGPSFPRFTVPLPPDGNPTRSPWEFAGRYLLSRMLTCPMRWRIPHGHSIGLPLLGME